ncbi:hypothetical protein [Streptomyces asiaticus]|uniref:hypothetical protein n=1 Tax=Streptomyces asiaticus TaxID=114695 RepID=UPI0037FA5796
MDRIYMNRIPGSERIHIEIDASEIADLLDDFTPASDAFEATKKLHRILIEALHVFSPELAEGYTSAQQQTPPAEGDQMT